MSEFDHHELAESVDNIETHKEMQIELDKAIKHFAAQERLRDAAPELLKALNGVLLAQEGYLYHNEKFTVLAKANNKAREVIGLLNVRKD